MKSVPIQITKPGFYAMVNIDSLSFFCLIDKFKATFALPGSEKGCNNLVNGRDLCNKQL